MKAAEATRRPRRERSKRESGTLRARDRPRDPVGREWFGEGPLPVGRVVCKSNDPTGPFGTSSTELRNSRSLILRPFPQCGNGVDATHAVVCAIAYSIWERRGGSELDNWLEAERQLSLMLCGD